MAELKLIWTPEPQDYPASDEEALILSQENEINVTATLTAKQKDQGVMPYLYLVWPGYGACDDRSTKKHRSLC